jgi:hypothetical protein
LIVLQREGSGQIAGFGREVFATEKIGLNGVAVGGQIIQQPAETNEVIAESFVVQGRLSFTQPPEPAEQMRVAAQLREPAKLGEGGAEIG